MSDQEPAIDLDALLNPDEQQRFRRLCLATTAEELAELPAMVQLHLDQVRELAEDNTDVETAERIAVALQELLSGQPDFNDDERALIRGAAEYFFMNDDADGDLEDVLGFDDDVRVLNSVLDRVNRSDLAITFD